MLKNNLIKIFNICQFIQVLNRIHNPEKLTQLAVRKIENYDEDSDGLLDKNEFKELILGYLP